MDATSSTLQRLDRYAREAVARSKRQYEREGHLTDKAREVFADPAIWQHKWVPDTHDFGEAHTHPVFTDVFTETQRLAWNHLQWGLDYARVAQGEMQLVALNTWACRRFSTVLPSVVELAERESFEEEDHIEGFGFGLAGLAQRYLPNKPGALYAAAPSGFGSNKVNRVIRHALGRAADVVLGSNFPTLFYLNRGLKTHGFQPFERAIASNDETPDGMRELSRLHRLDEARHMATAHQLSAHSREVLDTVARDDRWILQAAMVATWPRGRQHASRLTYWRTILDHSPTFATVPKADRDALLAHVDARLRHNLEAPMVGEEAKQVLPTNERLLAHVDLPPEAKAIVLDYLSATPEHARMLAPSVTAEA